MPVSLIFLSVPVGSWASAGAAAKLAAAITESSIFRCIAVLRCEQDFDSRAVSARGRERPSVPDPNIGSRRVLARRQVAAAGLARRYFGGVLRPDPFQPVRPPGARMPLALPSQRSRLLLVGLGPVQYWYFILPGGLTTPAMCRSRPARSAPARRRIWSRAAPTLQARCDPRGWRDCRSGS